MSTRVGIVCLVIIFLITFVYVYKDKAEIQLKSSGINFKISGSTSNINTGVEVSDAIAKKDITANDHTGQGVKASRIKSDSGSINLSNGDSPSQKK